MKKYLLIIGLLVFLSSCKSVNEPTIPPFEYSFQVGMNINGVPNCILTTSVICEVYQNGLKINHSPQSQNLFMLSYPKGNVTIHYNKEQYILFYNLN